MKLALLLLASPLLLAGCIDVVSHVSSGEGDDAGEGGRAVGTGRPVAESRPAQSAASIDVSGAFAVEIRKGPPSLRIEAQRELLPHIKTKVEGGCLRVWTEGSLSSDGTMRVVFTTPSLSNVKASGATNVDVDALTGDRVEVDLSGASKLQAAGRAGEIEITAEGASQAQLKEVVARHATVEASGASKAWITVHDDLQAMASGASEVRYYGKPARVGQNVSGVSSVRPG